MFLKYESTEMDDLERRKYLVEKEKYLNKFQNFKKLSGEKTNTIAKTSHNIFDPSPWADASAKNASFFYVLP